LPTVNIRRIVRGSRCAQPGIAGRIELLLSAYRRDDYADPMKFIAQAALVLNAYSDDIIEYVTDPRTGIQRHIKFTPSIAEIVSACEAEATHQAKLKHYKSFPPTPSAIRNRSQFRGPSFEDLVKKHGRPIGVFETGREFPYGAR